MDNGTKGSGVRLGLGLGGFGTRDKQRVVTAICNNSNAQLEQQRESVPLFVSDNMRSLNLAKVKAAEENHAAAAATGRISSAAVSCCRGLLNIKCWIGPVLGAFMSAGC